MTFNLFRFQFREQSTLTGVAQAIVDKVVRMHHDSKMSSTQSIGGKRDDITLLVRNFNYPLQCPASSTIQSAVSGLYTCSTSGTSSSSEASRPATDRNAKIKAYVDFSEYFINVERRRREGTLPNDMNY